MDTSSIQKIINRLRNGPDQIIALTWIAKDYSKLDLIRDLEAYIKETEENKYENAQKTIDEHFDNIRKEIAEEFSKKYPNYLFDVVDCNDDRSCFILHVYNVEDEHAEEIREGINNMDVKLFSNRNGYMVIPAIKNPKVTKEHYPQFFMEKDNHF